MPNTLSLLFLPHFFPGPEWGQSDIDSSWAAVLQGKPICFSVGSSVNDRADVCSDVFVYGLQGNKLVLLMVHVEFVVPRAPLPPPFPLPRCIKDCFSSTFLNYFFTLMF